MQSSYNFYDCAVYDDRRWQSPRATVIVRHARARSAHGLIVDDHDAILEGVTELLDDEGHSTATATDGPSALDQLRRGVRPCAILLALMMPCMTGWDFRQEQIKDDELSAIPVVVIIGAGFSNASLTAQLGDIEFVPKPCSAQALLAAVRRHCDLPTS